MYKSALLRTVQRHSRITAVTHAPVPMPSATGGEQEKNLAPERRAEIVLPVKASWVPTPATKGKSIPTDASIPGYAEQAPIQVFPKKLVSSSIVADTKKAEPPPTAGKDTPPPQNIGDEDNLWRRLQTIFNRHQEKEQQEDSLETVTQSDGEKPTETESAEKIAKPAGASQTERTGSSASSEATVGPVQRKVATPQQKLTDNLPATSIDNVEAATPSDLEFDIQPEEQARVSRLANQNPPSERPDGERKTEASDQQIPWNRAPLSQAEDQSTPPPSNESLSEVPSTSDDAIISAEARETQIPKSKISSDSSEPDALGNEPHNAIDEKPEDNLDQLDEPINLHPSPLQSVWPVQEKVTSSEFREAPQLSSPSLSDEPVKSKNTFTIHEADTHDRTGLNQEFGQIRNRLEQVRTTTSDSSIEYIPPRRPRPSSLAAQPAEPADLVQRHVEDKNLDTQLIRPAAGDRPVESLSPVRATQLSTSVDQEAHPQVPDHRRPIISSQPVQRFKDESIRPEMVGTEIGDLPADLWQLIGENPPERAEAPQAAYHSPEQFGLKQVHSSAPQVMRSPVGNFPAQDESQSPQSQTIQSQTEQTAAPAQSTPVREPAPQGDREKPAEQEVDIQELAKKVYSEIKQKMALEWERRRF